MMGKETSICMLTGMGTGSTGRIMSLGTWYVKRQRTQKRRIQSSPPSAMTAWEGSARRSVTGILMSISIMTRVWKYGTGTTARIGSRRSTMGTMWTLNTIMMEI